MCGHCVPVKPRVYGAFIMGFSLLVAATRANLLLAALCEEFMKLGALQIPGER